jgi:hypothetical protein
MKKQWTVDSGQWTELSKQIAIICLVFFCLLPTSFAVDTDITVQSNPDKNKLTIGEAFNYNISVAYPENYSILPLQKAATLGEFDVKDLKLQNLSTPGKLTTSITYTLAPYSTGQVLIPEIIIKYTDDKKKQKEIKTQKAEITVESLLAKYGIQGDVRDIKTPARFKTPVSEYIQWFLIITLIAGGFAFWYYKYQKRKRNLILEPEAPKIPPYEAAITALENLKNSSLIKEGRIKEFYIALADIIRDYVSGEYNIPTRDRTTVEIYVDLKKNIHDKKIAGALKNFFDECDLVKFAKYRPDEQGCITDWEAAKQIVTGRQ